MYLVTLQMYLIKIRVFYSSKFPTRYHFPSTARSTTPATKKRKLSEGAVAEGTDDVCVPVPRDSVMKYTEDVLVIKYIRAIGDSITVTPFRRIPDEVLGDVRKIARGDNSASVVATLDGV